MGATDVASSGAVSGEPTEEAESRAWPFLLLDDRGQPRGFASLSEACQAAGENAVVELRFRGPRRVSPISLKGKELILRSGVPALDEGSAEGGSGRPELVFQPAGSQDLDRVSRMFSLRGGRLRVEGVDLSLDLSEQPAASWAMFYARGAQWLEFVNCALQIRNPPPNPHLQVAFVEADSLAEAPSAMMLDPARNTPRPLQVIFRRCSIRGEAALLRSERQQPLELSLTQVLLILGRNAPAVDLHQAFVGTESFEHLRVTAREVTADLPGGLCQVQYEESADRFGTLRFYCQQSLFVLRRQTSLVHQFGSIPDKRSARDCLDWQGWRVHYDQLSEPWRIAPAGRNADLWDAARWQDQWGSQEEESSWSPQPWRNSPHKSPRPPSQRSIDDYRPADNESDPQVGVNPDEIPAFPSQ